MSELIRPVRQQLEPDQRADSTQSNKITFSQVPGFAGRIEINPAYLEPGSFGAQIAFHDTEHPGIYRLFVGAWQPSIGSSFPDANLSYPSPNGNSINMVRRERVQNLSPVESLFRQYLIENPQQLFYTRNTKKMGSSLVIGYKRDSTFVDTWMAEADSPRFRIHLPLGSVGDFRWIRVPRSRVFVFNPQD